MPKIAAKEKKRPLASPKTTTPGKTKPARSLPPWWPAVLIAAITVAVFWPATAGQFLNWDDDQNFLNNPNFRGLAFSNLRWMFTTFHLGHYQPLTWITLGLDYTLWGLNPFGYHLTNLLLHAANAALFYLLCLRLVGGRIWAASVAALLFAIHPLRVESVAWVTERRDVLSGLFYLLSLLAYLHAQTSGRRTKWIATSLVAFAAALLSKVIVVSLPVVLILLDVYPLRRPIRWAEKIPYFMLSAAGALIALSGQGVQHGALGPNGPGASGVAAFAGHVVLLPGLRIGLSLYALAFYLWKSIFPVGLYPQYTLPAGISFFDPRILAGAGVVVGITISVILLRRRFPAMAVAWGCYVAGLLPVLSIARVDVQQFAADHHTYLATLSLAILAAGGLSLLPRSQSTSATAAAAAAVVLLLFASLSYRQTRVWHDPLALWSATLEGAPDSAVAQNNFGEALSAQGNWSEAAPHFIRAVDLRPGYAQAHYNLARTRQKQGDLPAAIPEFHKAIESEPAFAAAYDDLANSYAALGQSDAAFEQYKLALRVRPDYPDAHYNLGNLLQQQRKFEQAISEYALALRSNPALSDAHNNWGVALDALGRPAQAIEHYRQALALEPANSDAHNNLGMSLEAQGKTLEAAGEYREALRWNPTRRDAQANLERLTRDAARK